MDVDSIRAETEPGVMVSLQWSHVLMDVDRGVYHGKDY